MKDISSLIKQAISALESEIETVRKKPSTDQLFHGKRVSGSSKDQADYRFESHQQAIRFAEEIKAKSGSSGWTIHPVSFEDNIITLRFPEDLGKEIEQLHVEWENDFVLKRTLEQIYLLKENRQNEFNRLEHLFRPDGKEIPFQGTLDDDFERNEAQHDAIRKAMSQQTLFIWGPPGTGKTATLGFIIANYLKNGKKVLFASNTNRAVGVGLLSAIDAISTIGLKIDQSKITRFGDAALKDSRLEPVLFDLKLEKTVEKKKQEAGDWISLLQKREKTLRAVEKRLKKGNKPTNNQELELKLIDQKIEDAGGLEELEDRLEDLTRVHDRAELWKKQFISTTLAKVCTSDLFHGLEFDAVVVDESSMANLPYLMVLAAHAKWHMVLVGDPMQLPPISLTSDRDARDFLEKDIFTTVSGANTSEELFNWHDENPGFTSFFDTQYRLESSLADIISTVFYEGRLKTGKTDTLITNGAANRAFHLVNTSRYSPYLEQKTGERGFKPVNTVHQQIVERLLKNMAGRGIPMEQIGVIVPFRSAVYDLRNRLYEANIRNVEVGTIHTFQGREKEYILFDTVMSGEQQRGQIRHYSVRPLDEEKNGLGVPRLLNVALSRCRSELVVIADMEHVNRVYGDKFLGRLLKKLGDS